MTRKQYEQIAAALAAARRNMSTEQFIGWHASVQAVASALATTNPNFDRERFLAACGVE
jgi:hypothetical protein